MITYTEAQAIHRVNELRRHGLWPGMVAVGGGKYRLTADPDLDGVRPGPGYQDTTDETIGDLGANQICPPADQA